MGKLSAKLKASKQERDQSLWKGPYMDDPNGGITQSMLSTFLVCRERFRIRYVLGLQPTDSFNHRIEYGSMWHCCEESLATGYKDKWFLLDKYTLELCERYPLQKQDIVHWHDICKLQFEVYEEYWAENEDVQERSPLFQEKVFAVPYILPSGRIVILRGKWDSVDVINGKVWLQENKTKGDINPVLMQRQLSFDLQTMIYLTALARTDNSDGEWSVSPSAIAGVRYNVIRRPLSGGKGSIRQKKNQTPEEFHEELKGLISKAVGPEWGMPPDEHYFFMRWKVEVTQRDIKLFEREFLDPILQQLCDWWDMLCEEGLDPFTVARSSQSLHWRMPYGVYSPLLDGRPTDLDEFLATGSTVGLHRADRLFKELEV